jgi:hypothetical protein
MSVKFRVLAAVVAKVSFNGRNTVWCGIYIYTSAFRVEVYFFRP